MDAGVGSIVVASAFASGMKDCAAATSGTFTTRSRSSIHTQGRTRREILRLTALLALGVVRTAATAAVNYQHHVGEYGLHWNFFLTLAALRGLTLFIPRAAAGSSVASGLLGVGVLLVHQSLLSFTNMTAYLHSNAIHHRTNDFISANKEGIFSLPGYFALHLLGCAVGAVVEQTAGPSSRVQKIQGRRHLLVMLLLTLSAVFVATSHFLQPVSRRACNAAYIFWMLGMNTFALVLLAAAAAALPTQSSPRLLLAVNDAMLPTFLVANVLTGVVNLSIDTLNVGDWGARVIVAMYMVTVIVAAVAGQRLMGKDEQAVTAAAAAKRRTY